MTRTFPKPIPLLLSALLSGGLTGCLYTSHHFNSGRILEPGNTAVTVGWGNVKLTSASCNGEDGYFDETDSLGVTRCVRHRFDGSSSRPDDTVAPDLSQAKLPKLSLGYRLGVRKEWGPFTGLEIGWHLEAPTNPGSAEFDLKLGLPGSGRGGYHHSLSGGWIVGSWTDNSFFGEYAGSRAFGGKGDSAHAVYASYRYTRLATQPEDAVQQDSLRFASRTRHAHQATLGLQWTLPSWPVVPDFLSPQATVSFPWLAGLESYPPGKSLLVDLNFGFGWRF